MTARIDTTLIIGLGLIGGSLARALRSSGFSRRVLGFGHREASLARGVELGVIDDYSLDLEQALAAADLVVIATPTLVAAQMLERVLPLLKARDSMPIVTDVASVKGNLQQAAVATWGAMPPRLILGHPIAGSERSGVEASRADLFVSHRVILTPVPENDLEALSLVRDMWHRTGAEVVDMSVAAHDAVLAATSHLPHMLAYALVDALAQSPLGDDIFRFAAGGFRDFTRIASSDPVMWRDIAIANRSALLKAIDQFSEHLAQLRDAVATEDAESMLQTFSRAKQARDEFATMLQARSQAADQHLAEPK
ncbi:prephenate dehydrogenase/arogenate dehydrogenase family protein [Parahaliea sp. F7430]|uniref:prephenate dehydrogenase n=1 Tax=Sediminihaliea albiluteola TaxID=2758564 RepID=A0A7W2YK12_9GAMM|nr:prephenate dehydrogenase/arogenate dehydrogenase family protein [Sediminihaliea albiluteola]MBA6412863.1 prephenate dehydrogenase/arogenate dehydrogenase family protein [Sediminihaliea albiluteola]